MRYYFKSPHWLNAVERSRTAYLPCELDRKLAAARLRKAKMNCAEQKLDAEISVARLLQPEKEAA
jgi:hypothetical protein